MELREEVERLSLYQMDAVWMLCTHISLHDDLTRRKETLSLLLNVLDWPTDTEPGSAEE